MKTKEIILLILIFAWMGVIFLFSNQTSDISEEKSDKVSEVLINIGQKITKKEIKPNRKKELIKSMRFYVRKTAHFTIYLILGLLIYDVCLLFNIKRSFIFSIVFCFIYACSDEFHQLFISGRTGQMRDVIIDFLGAVFGCFIFYLIIYKKKNTHKHKTML
jgi:VanZ family protein